MCLLDKNIHRDGQTNIYMYMYIDITYFKFGIRMEEKLHM